MSRAHAASRQGFTIVEAIAAITIMSIIALMLSFVLATVVDGYTGASVRGSLHRDLSVAMDQIVREVRSIPLDTAAPGVAPKISAILAGSMDYDGTGKLELVAGDLILTRPSETGAVLLSGVSSLEIEAFDESNVSLALPLAGSQCDAVRRVSITVTCAANGVNEMLRAKLFLRCTMDGVAP